MSYYDSDEEEDDSYSDRRWKELQKGSLLCLKCKKSVKDKDQVVACCMPPSYALGDDDDHPTGCRNILCRGCAASKDHPFHPCQCFTLGDHEKIIWCPECIKSFKKCNSCKGYLCRQCRVDDTKDYGLLCQHCCWAMGKLLGRLPAGVSVGCSPWPRYIIPNDIQKAVEKLHNKLTSRKRGKTSCKGTTIAKKAKEDKKPAAKRPAQKYVFVLLHTEGGLYQATEAKVVGVYSSKQLAVDGAKIKFEELSSGCYKDGTWTEPEIFEEVMENTSEPDDNGPLLRQVDQEGAWSEISLQKLPLDG